MAGSVVCANGHVNDNVTDEMRFCLECGALLELRCPNGHVSPLGRRFCPACGESLQSIEAHAPPAQAEPAQPYPSQPNPPQSYDPGGPQRTGGRRRGPMILVIIGVVVLAGAAVGAVFLFHKHSGGSGSNHAVPRTSATQRVATTLPQTTTSSPASTIPPTTVPPTTVPPTTPTTIAPNMAPVDTSAVASNSSSSAVSVTFSTYFGGINHKKWAQAYAAYSPAYQHNVTLPSFESVDGTSSDEDIVVTSISASTGGSLDVGVDFTSHQAAANGPSGETCTQWSLTYVLVPSGTGEPLVYLIQSATGGDNACST